MVSENSILLNTRAVNLSAFMKSKRRTSFPVKSVKVAVVMILPLDNVTVDLETASKVDERVVSTDLNLFEYTVL